MDLSVDADGNSRVEFCSYKAYNESKHLVDAIEAYRRRTDVYPERVLADTIYRNKENRKYCQCRGIRMSGPRLGRPPADQGKVKADTVGSSVALGVLLDNLIPVGF